MNMIKNLNWIKQTTFENGKLTLIIERVIEYF